MGHKAADCKSPTQPPAHCGAALGVVPCTQGEKPVEACGSLWKPKQIEAFEALKQALITAPVLAIPDLKMPFRV
eukprot:908708-Pelagomonas_calceolata.AAC.1